MSDLAPSGPAEGAAAALADGGAAVATPAEELAALVSWGAAAFYWAEADANPRVETYWDALHYITTSLSVGYANIFPVTPIGKIIGALVMTVGPALSARALDQTPRAPSADGTPDETAAGTALLATKLDAILAELRRAHAG
jgi:hypothetical protein